MKCKYFDILFQDDNNNSEVKRGRNLFFTSFHSAVTHKNHATGTGNENYLRHCTATMAKQCRRATNGCVVSPWKSQQPILMPISK